MFSQEQKISNNSYVVTKLEEINKSDGTFIYIESRDLFGKHWIRKYKGIIEDAELAQLEKHFNVNPALLTSDGNAMGTEASQIKLAEIFGEYKEDNKTVYNARIKRYENKPPDLKTVNEEITKAEESTILFHQSLVGKGNYDNLEYNINQIEPHAFKVSQEISENEKLNEYYSALYNKLHSAMNGADTIASGQVALNSSDIKVISASLGLNAIPIVGRYVGSAFKGVMEVIKSNEIKNHAINFKQLTSLNPDSRETILKKAAEKITLYRKEDINCLKDSEEVLNWREKSLLVRCEDFVVVNINDNTYTSASEILGCIDALKIILAVTTNQTKPGNIKEVIDQLVKIPTKYTFTRSNEIVLKTDEDHLPSITVGVFDDSDNIDPDRTINSETAEPMAEPDSTNNNIVGPKKKSCPPKCCIISSVTDIIYDNELLNNPELIKILVEKYGMNKAIDIGSLLSLDLINEVIENNDHELLLAGALSVQQEYTA